MRDRSVATGLSRSQRRYHRLITSIVVFVLVPLLAWPSVGWAIWRSRPVSDLSLVVFDETVLDDSYREHQALGLVLHSLKVPFSVSEGYIGAAPGGGPIGQWPSTRPDLVMLVDAYGVYVNDEGVIDPQGRRRVSGRLESSDVERISGWYERGTWLYGETQILGDPTPAEARERLEALFSVESSGWSGRWFEDLSTVPESLRTGDWDYTGSGIVMVSERDRFVLSGAEITGHLVEVRGHTPQGWDFDVPFGNWFEIVEAKGTVDAWLELPVTSSGAVALERRGLPAHAPMIIRGARTIYVAGDVSEAAVSFPLQSVAGSAAVVRTLPQTVDSAFFYRAYVPVVTWLVAAAESG
ncbi:hypothetical protein BMS3Abin02_02153 [bacterium BMS3Abin02]|nr:hypothetical protein BMS3Abin02_02153 [bacterium BMS3Abin02]GBE20980.1 hypothetical protein BMS3Bbin01_00321 [bacterium BMS3Bbin01]HDH26151.1 hypothetical protein [Actinomycetota bacterium]